MCTCQRRSSQSRRGIEPVIQAFKARTINAGELSLRVSEKELYWQTEYWNILMPVDIYRLAKHGEVVLRAWKMIVVLFVYFMGVEKFSRVKNLRLSV